LFQKALSIGKKSGDKWTIGSTSQQLSMVYTELNEFAKAEKFLSIARKIFEDIGNKRIMSAIYNTCSMLRIKQNRLDDALDAANTAVDIEKEIGSTDIHIITLTNLGIIYSKESRIKSLGKSRKYFGQALSLAREFGNKRLLADCYFEYARTFWVLGSKQDKNTARKNIAKALKIYSEIDLKARVKEIERITKMNLRS